MSGTIRTLHLPLGIPTSASAVKTHAEFIQTVQPDLFKKLNNSSLFAGKDPCNKAINLFKQIDLSDTEKLILWLNHHLQSARSDIAVPALASTDPELADGLLHVLRYHEVPLLRGKIAALELLAAHIGPPSIIKLLHISDVYFSSKFFSDYLCAARTAKISKNSIRQKRADRMFKAIRDCLSPDTRNQKAKYWSFNRSRALKFILQNGISMVRSKKLSKELFWEGCGKMGIPHNSSLAVHITDKQIGVVELALDLLTNANIIRSATSFRDQSKLYGGVGDAHWAEILFASFIDGSIFQDPELLHPKAWKSFEKISITDPVWSPSEEIGSISEKIATVLFTQSGQQKLNNPKFRAAGTS